MSRLEVPAHGPSLTWPRGFQGHAACLQRGLWGAQRHWQGGVSAQFDAAWGQFAKLPIALALSRYPSSPCPETWPSESKHTQSSSLYMGWNARPLRPLGTCSLSKHLRKLLQLRPASACQRRLKECPRRQARTASLDRKTVSCAHLSLSCLSPFPAPAEWLAPRLIRSLRLAQWSLAAVFCHGVRYRTKVCLRRLDLAAILCGYEHTKHPFNAAGSGPHGRRCRGGRADLFELRCESCDRPQRVFVAIWRTRKGAGRPG